MADTTREQPYRCSQEPHPGREFYGDGACAECGYWPAMAWRDFREAFVEAQRAEAADEVIAAVMLGGPTPGDLKAIVEAQRDAAAAEALEEAAAGEWPNGPMAYLRARAAEIRIASAIRAARVVPSVSPASPDVRP